MDALISSAGGTQTKFFQRRRIFFKNFSWKSRQKRLNSGMEAFTSQGMRIDPARAFRMETLLDIQNQLANALGNAVVDGTIDALSLSIARSVDPQCRLAAIVQCAYAIRRSELNEISMSRVFAGLPQQIWQSKTTSMRSLPPWPGLDPQHKLDFEEPKNISLVSMNAYEHALRLSIPRFVLDAIPNEQHVTHVFRHLRATFIFKKTQSTDAVQQYFGHVDPSVSRDYVHTNLMPYV